MNARLIAALLACATPLALPAVTLAQSDSAAQFAATTLNLAAEGEVHAAPDEAFLQAGVSTSAPTAAQAVAQNRTRMNAVIQAMAAQGIGGPDLQTSALELTSQYADEANGPRRLTGYQAHNVVTARVRDLPRVGAAVDALVAAGANEIIGVDFDLADRQPLEDQARKLAVKALEAKAALYADATGYHVKRLVNLSEGGSPLVQPMLRMATMAMAGRAPTPVAPGELTVRVSVNATYELVR